MSHHSYGANVEFKWGNKRGIGVKNKGTQFYESFVYDGVEYSLYDCVYFYHNDHVETSLGKLVKIFEKSNGEKLVKVVWFFRPSEIRNFLGTYQPHWSELFLASGDGVGVSNVNLLESVVGKCSVVCTSEDKRNPKPTETELERARFFFKCTFDVERCAIVEKFPNVVVGVKVEQFFNSKGRHYATVPSDILRCQVKEKDKARISHHVLTKRSFDFLPHKRQKIIEEKSTIGKNRNFHHKMDFVENEELRRDESVKPNEKIRDKDEARTSENVLPKRSLDSFPHENRKVTEDKSTVSKSSNYQKKEFDEKEELRQDKTVKPNNKVIDKDEARTPENVLPKKALDSFPHEKRKVIEEKSTIGKSNNSEKKEEFDEKEGIRQDGSVKAIRKVTEVTERPDAEKRRWFKKMPWEDRLKKAQELDTLVLLSNLDPSYTSYEVEDIVWHAFKEKVEARMLEWSPTYNSYYGRALVIFRTKDAAAKAISELNMRCLILEDGRVVCAKKGTVCDPVKQSTFTGHLTINRAALQKPSWEMRKAVSTSHCAQPNTIEYAMAIEWAQRYDMSEACWEVLCQKQMKEIDDVKNKHRTARLFFEVS